MKYGTLIGALLGFLIGGGPLGALILGAAGFWLVDRRSVWQLLAGSGLQSRLFSVNHEQVQSAFFTATFTVMGRVAKADGRVSEQEIKTASEIMKSMRLSPGQRKAAISLFNEGKELSRDLVPVLSSFHQVARHRHSLMNMFLELQLQAAYADGVISRQAENVLRDVCSALGISQFRLQVIQQRYLAQRAFFNQYQEQTRQRHQANLAGRNQLNNAYAVLGVSVGCDDQQLKKAYRRLMSQHHPDKLVAKGLPEEMVSVAKQKTQEIQAAYNLIKNYRTQKA